MSDAELAELDEETQLGDGWQRDIARINSNLVRGMIAALLVIAVGLVLMVIFLFGWLDRSEDSERIDNLEEQQDRLFTGYDKLFDQVEDLGGEPVVPPPEDVVEAPTDRPEVQEQELQDPERQDPEINDPDVNDPEVQDPEVNDPDPFDDPDPDDPVDLAALQAAVDSAVANFCDTVGCPDPVDDPDPTDDPEIQDAEIQDDEIQDPEIQDPEIDDPDPDTGACPPGTTATELIVATGIDDPGHLEFVRVVACVVNP